MENETLKHQLSDTISNFEVMKISDQNLK